MTIPSFLDILTGNLELFMETPVEVYQDLSNSYSQAIADNAYRMAALETGHFKSGGWTRHLNQGMESFGSSYPWGWSDMQSFWDQCPDYAPDGPVTLTGAGGGPGTGQEINYLQFPTPEASFYTLAQWLQNNNNDPSKWNPGDPDYVTKVNSIKLPTT
jgi:hypothetical protein